MAFNSTWNFNPGKPKVQYPDARGRRERHRDHASEMSMTVFGLRLANYSNGVSKLHVVGTIDKWAVELGVVPIVSCIGHEHATVDEASNGQR